MNRRRVMGVGTAVVLAGLGAFALVSYVQSAHDNARAEVAQTAVVIVDKHVPKGADAATIVAATHEGSVQQQNLADGVLTSESQVGAQFTSADLFPGDQLVEDRLTSQLDSGLPAGSVEFGVKLNAEAAVGGLVKAGDEVNVFLTFTATDDTQPDTYTTFASVPVTNVLTAATTTDESGAVKSPEYIVTLALTAEQSAQALKTDVVWLARPVVG